MPNAASRAAAHSSAFARARVPGPACAATDRANEAAAGDTDGGCQSRDIAGDQVSAVTAGRHGQTGHTVHIQSEMPGTPDLCHPESVRAAASHQAEAEEIAAELAAIARSGMVLPGSISQRRTRCGRRNCACHADPPRLHGPYWQWTRKVAAKTVCRWLSDDQHRDYQPWIDNDRRLHDLLARLEALGTAAFEADPRWQQRGRTQPS